MFGVFIVHSSMNVSDGVGGGGGELNLKAPNRERQVVRISLPNVMAGKNSLMNRNQI